MRGFAHVKFGMQLATMMGVIVPSNIRPASPAESSAEPGMPQAQAGTPSDTSSFQASIQAAVTASKGQDESKSQGHKQTRERSAHADESQSSDSQSGSTQDGLQGILYAAADYIPVIQNMGIRLSPASVSSHSLQNGVDANVPNVPSSEEPLSHSAETLVRASQLELNAAVSSGASPHPSNTPLESSDRSNGEVTVPTANDHSGIQHSEGHQNLAAAQAPTPADASSSKANDLSGASTNAAVAGNSEALATLAKLAPEATQVPNVDPQTIAEMLVQSPRQGLQQNVATVLDGESQKRLDGGISGFSAVSSKSPGAAKDGKDREVSESLQNPSHCSSQDGANTNPDQSSSQLSLDFKDHVGSPQSIANAPTLGGPSGSSQGAAPDSTHSIKSSLSQEASALSPGQAQTDLANAGLSRQPMVNTARLIQSINSSELKVGMQSDEFGKISITTSATRDAILAQIYVDHSDLARALTSHLPDIQSRFGSAQPFDIRVAMTSGASGMSADTSAGHMNQGANQEQRSNQSFARGIVPVNQSPTLGSVVVVPEAQHASSIKNRLDLRA